MIGYIDMVGDLFHYGHIRQLKRIYEMGYKVVVGVHSDKTVESYKRVPILNMYERIEVIEACKYVEYIIPDAPLIITKEYMDKYKIDMVFHGHTDEEYSKYSKMYKYPNSINKFTQTTYTKEISTTEIIRRIIETEKTDHIIKNLPVLIYGSKPKLTIGFIQLPTDLTLDIEIPAILSQIKDVNWRMQKLYFKNDDNEITEQTYKNAQNNIKKAVQVFLPIKSGYGKLDVIAMACTSISFTLGTSIVQNELQNGYPSTIIATDTATAILTAINSFTKKGVCLFTPYIDAIHIKYMNYLKKNNINIVSNHNLNIASDSITSSIYPDCIIEYAKILVEQNNNIDIMLLACSALRVTSYGYIDNLEEELEIPVITSNQALAWHCLHQSKKIKKEEIKNINGYGVLFKNF